MFSLSEDDLLFEYGSHFQISWWKINGVSRQSKQLTYFLSQHYFCLIDTIEDKINKNKNHILTSIKGLALLAIFFS